MITLHQIAAAVRAAKGEVLLCGPTPFGYIVRAVVRGKSCRIIVATTDRYLKALPSELGTETHVVSDKLNLQSWLDSLAKALAPAMHP